MSDTTLNVRLISAHHTEEEWELITSIPKNGELCFTDGGIHANWIKRGNGQDQWKDLEYIAPEATPAIKGLMSASDKVKLNGIEENANNYVLPVATDSTLGGVLSGNDIAVTANGNMIANIYTYNFTTTIANDQITVTAELYRGSELVTTIFPATSYTWYLKTEDGLTYLGSGYSYTLNISAITYFGTIVGVWNKPEATTEQGD